VSWFALGAIGAAVVIAAVVVVAILAHPKDGSF
jgi:hypothetical protein